MNIKEWPCLAYLSSDCVDEGVVVEVLTPASPTRSGLPAWNVKARDPIECEFDISKRVVMLTEFCAEDAYLRPITPPGLVEEITIDELIGVEA
jgi:hypothetical protein